MSYYFMANIRVRDEKEYQKYLDPSGEIFSQYNGTYLAVDASPKLIEGNWDYSRAVLIRFESREDFENWYRSDGYQKILKYRLAASDCDSILIQGKS